MTYKDIQGLKKHSDLYKYFKTINHGLDEYQRKLHRNKRDTWLLKSSAGFFFEILDTIVREFSYKFPECEVRSETGRLIMPTAGKLKEKGLISGEVYELFDSLYRYGTIGGLQGGTDESFKQAYIVNVYNKLLKYMPDFLRQFPEPGKPSASKKDKTSDKNNCGEARKRSRIVISVAVGASLITAISFASAANSNRMMDLQAQLSEVEAQIASITAEKEELEEERREDPREENGETLEEESEEEYGEESGEVIKEESEEKTAEVPEENVAEEADESAIQNAADTNSASVPDPDTLNGVCIASDGIWYYYKNGEKQLNYTGFASNSNGEWYVEKGKVTKETNGVFKDTTGAIGSKDSWYYVIGSKVQTDFTGLADYSNSSGWWYITDGKVDRSYTGIATNCNGTWCVLNGKVDRSYSGMYIFGGSVYSVKDGKADETGQLGTEPFQLIDVAGSN